MTGQNDILGAIMRNDYYLAQASSVAQANMAAAIDELERRIIKDVASLKTKGASLVGPRVNLKQAQQIQKSLNKHFLETYGAEARKTVTGFKQAAAYVNGNWAGLDKALAFADVDADMISTLGKQYYGEFAKYGKAAQSSISTAMYNSIAAQQPHSDLVKSISAALTGKYSKRGAPMSQYAELFAFDGMMNFSQATNLAKAEEGGFDTFLYYGNVMSTTRMFCRERVGQTYKRKDIVSWTFPWTGKSGPAMTHRGGYNCRHHWQPVLPEWLEGDDIYYMQNRSSEAVNTYYMSMDHLAQYGVKQGSKGAKFVEALITKSMTNTEIKALSWNTTGNLHGDIFSKLKAKGLAGIDDQGKKWVKSPGLQINEVVDKPSPVIKAGIKPTDLQDKLKTTGGNPQMVSISQWDDDPNLDKIFNYGVHTEYTTANPLGKYTPNGLMGVDGECHWNVAKLFVDGDVDDICIGYTQNFHGWHQHTWGLKGGQIIETTASNLDNYAYYGYKLNKAEAATWSKFVKEHPPGAGFVNTTKGGSLSNILDDTLVGTKAAPVVEVITEKVPVGAVVTPEDFGIDSATMKGKFVQALIDEPMTNTEIKALSWNTSGNLHGDVFNKLKAQGYAGTHKGKKWVSLAGEPPESLVKGTLDAVIEEAAPGAVKVKPGKVTKHFGDVKSKGYVDADNDYFFTASNAHISDIHTRFGKLDNLTAGKPKLKGLRLNKGIYLPDGNGRLGKYTPGKRTISIAGETSKEHTLTLGSYNASADYYGILRHEYGHHVWDINKAGPMVDDFRQLHLQAIKGNPNFFKSSVSKYAAESVEDAFAEAFSAYTSPLYKKGKLPKQLENFFDHWAAGKKATYKSSWVAEKITPKANPKKLFIDPDHQKSYSRYKAEYTAQLKEFKQKGYSPGAMSKEAKKIYTNDLRNTWIHNSAGGWQGSTNYDNARLIKFMAEQIENRPIKTRITNMSSKKVSELWLQVEKLNPDPYLRAKALTKAYHDVMGQKTVRIYRGIGGDHGRKYLKEIRELKNNTPVEKWGTTKIVFKEDSMVGYSGNPKTAFSFSQLRITRKVDVDDILLSDQIWAKQYHHIEREYIMIGGDYEVMLKDIELR